MAHRLGDDSDDDEFGFTNETLSGKVNEEQFCELMREALLIHRGMPRSYLLPSGVKKGVQQPTFRPEIDARSKVSLSM